ncbi:hypothetical protein LMJF_18_0630 [Leishmania major strain Friedlin]|uniref:Uncharacterized protein n=1 Tax=Leishmania major TaxID=5664 RepID=Q4QDX8_LEIMA|nr:hypothetical protein LMJF_18_0630 [Leishmania major strain Friedlin]CAG9572449.1 hypothetical_protein_-_conserved [Leishmania major strain Friedlin]CAJ03674.1 hypothetical protein LMJF_18_0630 [Leishmania major strain Friedlin]|eukprot:XP_001682470.1 hypothetical protein LMJF_18_0630 [Leishmania major strain Friedlin]
MRAYIDSICNRKPPSKAPQVRPTKSALLLLSHQQAKRRQLGESQADGSISTLKHPHPQPRAAAAKWPLKTTPSLGPPPRPLACRSPSPLAHDVLARTPPASSVEAAESPWHPLFTSASQLPATSPRQQQRPAHRASEEESEAGVREEYWPTLARSLEAGKDTSVAVAAYGDRRLYDGTAEGGEGGHRKAYVMHASAAERGSCATSSPTRTCRSAWTPWHPPPHGAHQDLVRSDAASPFQTNFRLRYPSSSSCTSPAPHARSEMEPPRVPRASSARPSMTSDTRSDSNLAALSHQCPTSPAWAVDLNEPPRRCHPVSAPQQQLLARVHARRESYSSSAHCTTDADVIANTQHRPDSPPCRPSLSSLFSSGFFSRGPEAAMHRRAERYSTVAHRAGNPCTRFLATAQSAASSLTKESQQASQPRPGADYRCRDVNNCSLRDLQEGLCTRLQRRLHDLEPSHSSSTSPMDWKAAAGSTKSTPLLADMDATLRLWRDTRRALRQQVMHRSAIHDVQRSTPLKGQWPNVEEDIVLDGVVRRILAERAASRAYLLAGAAAANREARTP